MAKALIFSVLGKDRPGLVEAVAETVAAHGGNWVEARMANLAGEFAGVVRVDAPSKSLAALEAALVALKSEGVHVSFAEAPTTPPPRGSLAELELMGQDHPGMLAELTAALAAAGVSVEALETEVAPAPGGGGELFHARATLRLPPDADEIELGRALEAIAHDIMADITLAPAEDAT